MFKCLSYDFYDSNWLGIIFPPIYNREVRFRFIQVKVIHYIETQSK